MRLADYVVETLKKHGITDCFMVTGGGAMHLNDAIGKQMNYISMHHEQSCAMAADSYFRVSGRMALVCTTTGPGATNAITGVYGAYTDSLAMVVISGQVKRATTMQSVDLPLRQLGDQEVDIISMVKGITKYAVMVTDPSTIRFHLEKALALAVDGRPGPVWLDIPIDVQSAEINTDELLGYKHFKTFNSGMKQDVEKVLYKLQASKRPVILAGAGVRISGEYDNFLKVIKKLGIPVCTTWNAHDLIWNDHELYAGRQGMMGDRAGNFAVQNSDFLLVLGSRLSIRQVSYNWASFAREAYKVMVDIDLAEIRKPTLKIDYGIHGDLSDFFYHLLQSDYVIPERHREYVSKCREWVEKYPVVKDNRPTKNPYVAINKIIENLPSDAIVVCGNGSACVVTFQATKIKKGMRVYTNSGAASMGYDLPAAIGAYVATGKRITCLTGDGSIMMNIQELSTISHHKMPIIIFVINNNGYHSIRQSSTNNFPESKPIGFDKNDLSFPDVEYLIESFGVNINVVNVNNDPFSPKLNSKKLEDGTMVSPPPEDMWPHLPRQELLDNLLIDPWPET